MSLSQVRFIASRAREWPLRSKTVQTKRKNLTRKTHLPSMGPLVLLKPARLAIRFPTAIKSAMIFSLCVFHQRSVHQNELGFLLRVQERLWGLGLGFWSLPGDIALFVIRF